MSKVLIIGSGGREHAIGWSISQDPTVDQVIYAPGNPGTEMDKKGINIDIDGTKKENFEKLFSFVDENGVDQVIVGPEQPLVDGIVNFFNDAGYESIFGPTSEASIIEADKFYSHVAMFNLGIPQAKSRICFSSKAAEKAIKEISTDKGVVIKAKGLTGGKGVYVCNSKEEALSRLKEHSKKYESKVLISERLFGQEFSVFGISDGNIVMPLGISVQDHKPLFDGDKGPNTGGMGAYAPAPIADSKIVKDVANTMMTPLVQLMKKDFKEYKGFLYAGCIMTEEGPKILEYNCRFGDPEAQPAVMMLEKGLYKPISYALEGRLDEIDINFKPGAACCVVMASNGYPSSYKKGFEIGKLDENFGDNVKIFHAGTKKEDEKILTSGGRVLGVTAYSPHDIESAIETAYGVTMIIDKDTQKLNNKEVFHYRTDIGAKAMV